MPSCGSVVGPCCVAKRVTADNSQVRARASAFVGDADADELSRTTERKSGVPGLS
jgi:hypothetical protein